MLLALAVAAGGCSDAALSTSNETSALEVTRTCVQNIFYNGLLPKAPAQAECTQCVVHALAQIGLTQTPGESPAALIANVHLTANQASELGNACDQADSSD